MWSYSHWYHPISNYSRDRVANERAAVTPLDLVGPFTFFLHLNLLRHGLHRSNAAVKLIRKYIAPTYLHGEVYTQRKGFEASFLDGHLLS